MFLINAVATIVAAVVVLASSSGCSAGDWPAPGATSETGCGWPSSAWASSGSGTEGRRPELATPSPGPGRRARPGDGPSSTSPTPSPTTGAWSPLPASFPRTRVESGRQAEVEKEIQTYLKPPWGGGLRSAGHGPGPLHGAKRLVEVYGFGHLVPNTDHPGCQRARGSAGPLL
jgi:hypothetical protein